MEKGTIGGTEEGCPSGEREFSVGGQSGGTQSLEGELVIGYGRGVVVGTWCGEGYCGWEGVRARRGSCTVGGVGDESTKLVFGAPAGWCRGVKEGTGQCRVLQTDSGEEEREVGL